MGEPTAEVRASILAMIRAAGMKPRCPTWNKLGLIVMKPCVGVRSFPRRFSSCRAVHQEHGVAAREVHPELPEINRERDSKTAEEWEHNRGVCLYNDEHTGHSGLLP